MLLTTDHTFETFTLIMEYCFNIMKTKFVIFGLSLSLWDFFLWGIVMYALLKLFFALFE